MIVVQINATCGSGSTGVIAVEIADLLEQNGHKAYIAFGQGSTNYPNAYKIGSNAEKKIHALINTRIWGEEGSGSVYSTYKFVKWLDAIHPDIIHIHNLHSNFLNYRIFFSYLIRMKIPVVWSFFDCWPFTGKCTHFTEIGCRKWETECKECPQLKTSGAVTWFFDKTKKMFHQKKNWFKNIANLHIIVCSNWLKGEVEKSFLKERPIHMIYNWIDTYKFREIHDETIYNRYGIDRNKKILLSVSAFWDDKTTRFRDALRLAKILPDQYQLVLIGRKKTKGELLSNMVHIDYVNGTEELSKLYTAALVFIGFSVEDTFGKVFAESMLCGTPAIVFNSTACPEVVGSVGYAVRPHDVKEILDKIKIIDDNGKEFYSQRCIDHVTSCFDYKTNVGQYLYIYQQIIKEEKQIDLI